MTKELTLKEKRIEKMDEVRWISEAESHNSCDCGYLDERYDCDLELHVWFVEGLEKWAAHHQQDYMLYKNYDLEFYTRDMLAKWNSLNDVPNSFKIRCFNLKRWDYDRT